MTRPVRIGSLAVLALWLATTAFAQGKPDDSFRYEIAKPAYPHGEGPLVCVDRAHRNYHAIDGPYRPFATLLRGDGYRVEPLGQAFSAESLKECRVLAVISPVAPENIEDWAYPHRQAFAKDEVRETLLWVYGGGALLLVVDHAPIPGAVGDLATALGLNMFNGEARNDPKRALPDVFPIIQGHPILQGRNEAERVTRLATWTGHAFLASREYRPLIVFGPRSRAWAMLGDTVSEDEIPRRERPVFEVEGWLHAAARRWGGGRIVVLGEAAMCTALGEGDDRWGMNAPGAEQNAPFCLNVLHWLTGLLD